MKGDELAIRSREDTYCTGFALCIKPNYYSREQYATCSAKRGPVMPNSRSSGFSLVELIMVMVITGVLAVFALPRFFDTNDFVDKGFGDETLAILRYAQKAAVAQRRTVCVAFSATKVILSVTQNASPATCVTGPTVPLQSPTGAPQFTVSATGSASFSPVPVTLQFNALGQPLDGSGVKIPPPGMTITIVNGSNAQVMQITVEAETGYVH
jgi:MSHA pilin protein MshC